MTPSTINATSFLVTGPGAAAVPGSVSYNVSTHVATFSPTNALAAGTPYTATITSAAKDVAGQLHGEQQGVGLLDGSDRRGELAPALGAATNFVILAGSTITSTGATALTGDLGVSPGTAVTGFPPATFTGSMHAGNPTSAAAIADLTIAYNDAGRSERGADHPSREPGRHDACRRASTSPPRRSRSRRVT
jgi:hypothetical protein